jgi:hypothetical protein
MDESRTPQQVETPDFTELKDMCQEYIDQLEKYGYADDDLKEYIFEAAMECVFDKDVFIWICKCVQDDILRGPRNASE